MKPWTNHGALALAIALGAVFACADDQNATTPAETTNDTDPDATTTSESTDTGPDASTGTTGTGTTVGIKDLDPWYGIWYAMYSEFTINEPEWWGSGGDGLAFTLFELRTDSATIYQQNCLWGNLQYEYILLEDNGEVFLEPIGGEHKYLPHGAIARLYLEPGADCSALVIREVHPSGEEGDLFAGTEGLKRGELCLMCAPTQGMQGVISDCGTPVPWECPG